MKVLQLGKFYPIKGGVEKVMEIFTEGLAERGFASDMLCASHDGETTDIVFSEESRIFRTKTLTKLAATMISPEMIFRLRRICSEYDIIPILWLHWPSSFLGTEGRWSYTGTVIS